MGTNTEEEDIKQLPLEKKIRDLQQENASLQGVVAQKTVHLQQTISIATHVKAISTLEGECADRSDLCCLERVCVCFRYVTVWGELE